MRVLFVVLISLQVTVCAAQARLSVTYNNTPFYDVLLDLQNKLGKDKIRFDPCFQYTKPVTYKAKNELLTTVLAHVFQDQPLEAKLVYDCFIVAPRDVKGQVVDEYGAPQAGVSISREGARFTYTDMYGNFEMYQAACDSVIYLSSVNLQPHTEPVKGRTWIDITMKIQVVDLDEKDVYHNGYGNISKERITGSVFKLTEQETKRQVFSSVKAALEHRALGLYYKKNLSPWNDKTRMEIRGTSTIHAGSDPLIIIDKLPIANKMEFEMLNPQDVLSITVLKDAAATSIWGVRAGNGVLVVTTKKGRFNKPPKVVVTNSVAVSSKPDLRYMPFFTSSNYIDMETARFDSKYYDNDLQNPYALVSPVVVILKLFRDKKITETQKNEMLEELRSLDVRNDLKKYFYRNAITYRHFASISGGSTNANYYLSAGYDGEQMPLVTASRKRLTTNAGLQLRKKKFQLSMNSYFSYGLEHNDREPPGGLFPFSRLKTADGAPATVLMHFNQHFKDSMRKYLQNWDYRPLQELYARGLIEKNFHYRLAVTGTYSILEGFDLSLMYQFNQGRAETEDISNVESYEARHLVNSFARIKNARVDYIIPKGGFMDWQLSKYRSDRVRAQLDYKSKTWKGFELVALAGFESSALQADTTSFRYYAFYGDRRRPLLDYGNKHAQSYDSSQKEFIPQPDKTSSTYDGFLSFYGNVAINYKNRYTFSASRRLDQSNLFGVATKKKTVTLGSVGFKWDASEEPLYPLKKYIPYLTFRASLGSSGNVDKYTTAFISAIPTPANLGTIYSVVSPANPELRWEKSKMFNFGFSLTEHSRHYYLSFDCFNRKSIDLIGPRKRDPVTGTSIIWGNFAQLKSWGYEFGLKSDHHPGEFGVENQLLIGRSRNKVTSYYNVQNDAGYYVDNRHPRPREGYPVNTLFAFAWGGLENGTGNPVGFLNDTASKDYNGIIQAQAETLVDKGSADPTLFGTLQSTISWRNWKVSFTLAGKFGYSFRRSSVSYSDPYSITLMGRNDFSNQWQKEKNTNVPSMQILNSEQRDLFYAYSEALVEKGGHIRLHDVRLEFDFKNILPKTWKIQSMTGYVYASNLGIIWTANKLKIDPDYLLGPPVPKSITTGFSFEF